MAAADQHPQSDNDPLRSDEELMIIENNLSLDPLADLLDAFSISQPHGTIHANDPSAEEEKETDPLQGHTLE